MRQAVLDLAEGRVGEALAAFESHGQLKRCVNQRAAEAELVAAWGDVRDGESLTLASTRAEVSRLNSGIQRLRVRMGELGEVAFEDGGLRIGDSVVLTRNNRFLGVRNGDVGVIENRMTDSGKVAVRLRGKVVFVVKG